MLWVDSKCFFQKTVFFLKFGEPLPISIDPFCFSIDRNFLIMLERVSVCFDRSKLFFNCSNSFQIVLIESLSVSIDRGCFSIDRNSWILFFKRSDCFFSKVSFSKLFNLFSLSDLAKAPPSIFCRFPPSFLQGFLSLKAGKSLLPFLLHFISCFHAFFMHYCGYFRHFLNIEVFDDSNMFWWNWLMGFCPRML